MYPMAETPVHEALPLFGLSKLCRFNSWLPALNPYTWRFFDHRRVDESLPPVTAKGEEAIDVEALTPMMKAIRIYLLKAQYKVRDEMNAAASKEKGQDEVKEADASAYGGDN